MSYLTAALFVLTITGLLAWRGARVRAADKAEYLQLTDKRRAELLGVEREQEHER